MKQVWGQGLDWSAYLSCPEFFFHWVITSVSLGISSLSYTWVEFDSFSAPLNKAQVYGSMNSIEVVNVKLDSAPAWLSCSLFFLGRTVAPLVTRWYSVQCMGRSVSYPYSRKKQPPLMPPPHIVRNKPKSLIKSSWLLLALDGSFLALVGTYFAPPASIRCVSYAVNSVLAH